VIAVRITPLAAFVIAGPLLLAPAAAQAASDATVPSPGFAEDMQRAAELMRQGLNKALGSVETLLRAVPRYELPQIDANGDIIIRRKPPDEPATDPGSRSI
jgi:hypothetical protein